MDKASKLIDSITGLITALVDLFGTGGTIAMIIITALAVLGWKLYVNSRKDAAFKKLIEEKDRTIERMKDEVKLYRISFFKKEGWSDAEIEKFVK
jgi:hypothetical protein